MKKQASKTQRNQSQAKPKAEKLKKISLKDLENVTGGMMGDPMDDPMMGDGGLGPAGIN